jgi:lipopolysaccharide/colanic/teichoic acid biosynthesis glycosyltransferase
MKETQANPIAPVPQVICRGQNSPQTKTNEKRAWNDSGGRHVVDVFLAALALLILTPFLILIAAGVLVSSGLPILFKQHRVGRGGKLFQVLKFRTMKSGKPGPSITSRGDSRITPMGRVLRKFKLDELPQLWNVFRGDMSLVGPRPEVPRFVDMSDPVWRSVLQVRPGITDPASIAFRNEEEILAKAADPIAFYENDVLPAKLALNLAYLEKRSFLLDMQVILKTARCAISPGRPNSKESRV